jgi:hypothetical protein
MKTRPCEDCGNKRKKTYAHLSGRHLCRGCLVERARGGRKDFRHKLKTAAPEASGKEDR